MTSIQNKVTNMHNGNIDAILSCISSKNNYLVMNAILSGAKLRLNSEPFLVGLKNAQNNETVLLGFPIKSVAKAALHFITGEKYTGNDELVSKLIASDFAI